MNDSYENRRGFSGYCKLSLWPMVVCTLSHINNSGAALTVLSKACEREFPLTGRAAAALFRTTATTN